MTKSASTSGLIPAQHAARINPDVVNACPNWCTAPGHDDEDPCERMHWGVERHVAASTDLKLLSVYAGQWMYAADPHVVVTLSESGREEDLLKLTMPEARSLADALKATVSEVIFAEAAHTADVTPITAPTPPPCPDWCGLPEGHPYDLAFAINGTVTRVHCAYDDDVVDIRMVESWSPEGVELFETEFILLPVGSAQEKVSAEEARRIAAALLAAADRFDAISKAAVGQPASGRCTL